MHLKASLILAADSLGPLNLNKGLGNGNVHVRQPDRSLLIGVTRSEQLLIQSITRNHHFSSLGIGVVAASLHDFRWETFLATWSIQDDSKTLLTAFKGVSTRWKDRNCFAHR
jgi:hypothetical protein